MAKIGYIGFILMLAGIALDPVDGGITKDHCNLSYLFTTSGMAALTAAFILMLEIRWNIKVVVSVAAVKILCSHTQ